MKLRENTIKKVLNWRMHSASVSPNVSSAVVQDRNAKNKEISSLVMPMVSVFTTSMLIFSIYLFISLPSKIEAVERFHFENRCEDIFEKFRSLIYDTHTIGEWAFSLIKEGIYSDGASLHDAIFPHSAESVLRIQDFNIAEWAHTQIKERLDVRGTFTNTSFSTNVLLAPIIYNTTKWDIAWSRIGPIVFNNSDRDYTVNVGGYRRFANQYVDLSEKTIWAPFTYTWTHFDLESEKETLEHLFAGDALVGPVSQRIYANVIENSQAALAAMPTADGGFGIGNLYPIYQASDLTDAFATPKNQTIPDALGLFVFTLTKAMLESQVHNEERLQFSYIDESTIVKGKHFQRGKVYLRSLSRGSIFPSHEGTILNPLSLKCLKSTDRFFSAAKLVQISCGFGIVLSIFFFVLLGHQHARENKQAQNFRALESERITLKAVRDTEDKLQHYVNHEIKNKLYILHDIIMESHNARNNFPVDLATHLIADTLMNIRRKQLVISLHNNQYTVSNLLVNPIQFIHDYVQVIRLVHGGRSLIQCVPLPANTDISSPPLNTEIINVEEKILVELDTLLFRALLMSIFHMITTIGKPASSIDFYVQLLKEEDQTDSNDKSNNVQIYIIASADIATNREWRLLSGAEISPTALHDNDLQDIREIDKNSFHDAIDTAMACIKYLSICKSKHSITIRQTDTQVQVLAKLYAQYSGTKLDHKDESGDKTEQSLPLGTILVLDDSAFVLKMMSRKLRMAFPEHTVVTFGHPDQAYEFVVANTKDIVLCLLDEQLGPGVPLGTDLAKRIIIIGYQGLLISISANSTCRDWQYYKSVGIHGMVGKDCVADKLKDRIHRVNSERNRPDSPVSSYDGE